MPAEIQNFLVAIDGSESAGRSLDVAAAMAKAAHVTLRIVTVGESPTALQQTDTTPTKGNLTERLLEEAQQRAGWTGVKPVKDPAQAIIDTIMEEKVDAVVIGRRGRGRL